MEEAEASEQHIIAYLVEHGHSLSFTKFFWKECEPLPRDIDLYAEYVDAVTLSRNLGTSAPKLALYLKALMKFGEPSPGWVWLNTECSHGYGNPIGDFVKVPKSISSWTDVERVLGDLGPIGMPSQPFTNAYMFGFFVGIIIGDAHKPKQGRGHRHVDVTLSQRYQTNVAIGDFATLCANQLGLRMKRCPDIPKPEDKPFGFYVWRSQSSPLVDWIFNIVLGLNDGQHTTYDPVQMDWLLDAPLDFRVGLMHGIAESDGSVSVASQTVEFWVIPDWDLMIKLLATFGLRGFRNREAVSLVKSQAIGSFSIPVFAPHLRTVRYGLLELMATTRRLDRKERIPDDVRSEIIRLATEGKSIPSIVVEIARTKRLLVSFEAAQRWAKKSGKYEPRTRVSKDEDGDIIA